MSSRNVIKMILAAFFLNLCVMNKYLLLFLSCLVSSFTFAARKTDGALGVIQRVSKQNTYSFKIRIEVASR